MTITSTAAPITRLPEELVDRARDEIEELLLATLTRREARVLRLRFGIGQQPCSAALAARRLHVRITTVLRLQARALGKLRAAALPHPKPRHLQPLGT